MAKSKRQLKDEMTETVTKAKKPVKRDWKNHSKDLANATKRKNV